MTHIQSIKARIARVAHNEIDDSAFDNYVEISPGFIANETSVTVDDVEEAWEKWEDGEFNLRVSKLVSYGIYGFRRNP